MGHRSKRAIRCTRCRLHTTSCICEHIEPIASNTRLALVMHHREVDKPTATGPLALLALSNSELFVHGLRESLLDLHHLQSEGRRVLVLFPAEGARTLDQAIQDGDARPITLVVPDGSWRQAHRMPRRIPGLENVECVVLPAGPNSRWGIRKEPVEGGVATFEAIARAFGILESSAVQSKLEALFDQLVEATLAASGRESKAERPITISAEPPLSILYLDQHLVAVNKPSGVVTHLGWAQDGMPALQQLRDQIGRFVYPVHRLDRSTSGVLLFALSSEAARDMQALHHANSIDKRYLALCRGHDENLIHVDHALRADENDSTIHNAVTDFRLLGTFERYGLYQASPRTGRTHQIRRHLKHVSQPIVGDVRYGKGEHNRIFRERFSFQRLALHCHQMSFVHPRTSEPVAIRAPLEGDFARLLEQIGLAHAADGNVIT